MQTLGVKTRLTMPDGLPRRYMHAVLRELPYASVPGLRPPTPADAGDLASLMLQAYMGTVDYEGEGEAEAVAQVNKTISGESGAFSWSCSRVIQRGALLAAATLVTRWQERPFIAFTMTHPNFKRTGLARACMVSAMRALLADGEREVRLAVTLANTEAIALYQSLGFAVQK